MAPTHAESLQAITASLPPATDNLTYCTILEYHLSKELLPDLHNVLQDRTLTSEIGWDLVNLLTPLLPDSKQCLEDVGRLGNPRECVIKALEGLREIKFPPKTTSDSDDEEKEQSLEAAARDGTSTISAAAESGPVSVTPKSDSKEDIAVTPRATFSALISLLSTLHPRIKTAYPSRFLSTSLQAILATYTEAVSSLPPDDVDEITSEIVNIINVISGKKRPALPPRRSTQDATPRPGSSAPDPEATEETPSSTERALQTRLLQAFVTHVLEDYILAISKDDIPGLAWSIRLEEKMHPEKLVPRKVTLGQRFAEDPQLQANEAVVGQIVAIAKDLELSSDELLKALVKVDSGEDEPPKEEELPTSPSDVPLSIPGSLFLLSSRVASNVLFASSPLAPNIAIFPDHAEIVRSMIGKEEEGGISAAGNEPEAVIDCVLALGLLTVNGGSQGELDQDEETFFQYLQKLSLVSANCPSPALRYNAHLLCSSILRVHPSDLTRLSFIRDTLEHCPYENLKGSAVGWLKDEILAAEDQDEENPSVFSTSVAIETLASHLFPDVGAILEATLPDAWASFQISFSFYLASLNFYYLLCHSPHLRQKLDVSRFHHVQDVGGTFIDPLRTASQKFGDSLKGGELAQTGDSEGSSRATADLALLDNVLDRVMGGIAELDPFE
ncbi:MAG: hypothetical protein M4579_002936 [Chaenotheca gracillima]|nr:MAG: hypothetical protein M4579_002936 [Chaenotheca gracillima]